MDGTFRQVVERIRDAVDIVDFVGHYVALRRAGRNYKGLCPFHEEKTPSFNVNPAEQIFKCFGCGAGGDIFKFVQRYQGVSFREAVQIIADRAGIRVHGLGRTPGEAGRRQRLFDANRWAWGWFRRQLAAPAGRAAREYLQRRGITTETVERFGLGYAPQSFDALLRAARTRRVEETVLADLGLCRRGDRGLYDAFRHRLMFPILDVGERVVGFGGRTLGDDPAKYINSAQSDLFDKSRCLFGIHLARPAWSRKRRALVVEGYMDVLMAHQMGFDETVATLGVAFTEHHARLLRRFVSEVVVAFDADSAGREAAARATEVALSEGLTIRVAVVPEGKDPCDYLLSAGAEAFAAVLNSAPDALEFCWEQVQRAFEGEPGARRRAVEEFLGLAAAARKNHSGGLVTQGVIASRVATLLGVTPAEVVEHINRLAAPGRRSREAESGREGWPRKTAPADRESAAQREILAVLLVRPALYAQASPRWRPERLADPHLREIAQVLHRRLVQGEEPTCHSLLAEIEDIEAGDVLIDLHDRSAAQGHFESRLRDALAVLEEVEHRREVSRLAEALTDPRGAGSGQDPDALLRAVGEHRRRVAGFGGCRVRETGGGRHD